MYRNSEGYADPTAGLAMSRVMREYRNKQKARWKRQYEMKHRKKIYVTSGYAGTAAENWSAARRYCRYVVSKKGMPVACQLLYPQVLDDGDPGQRELGLMFGLALLAMCDEVWCFGDVSGSESAQKEISEAKRLGKEVRYMKEIC
jgi:hypothetical protein